MARHGFGDDARKLGVLVVPYYHEGGSKLIDGLPQHLGRMALKHLGRHRYIRVFGAEDIHECVGGVHVVSVDCGDINLVKLFGVSVAGGYGKGLSDRHDVDVCRAFGS
jgi:hypothetical protein